MKLKNPGFRKGGKSTGLAAIGSPHACTYISMGRGNDVGCIFPPNSTTKGQMWKVGFTTKREITEENPCKWQWTFLKRHFSDDKEARQYIRETWFYIHQQLDICERSRD